MNTRVRHGVPDRFRYSMIYPNAILYELEHFNVILYVVLYVWVIMSCFDFEPYYGWDYEYFTTSYLSRDARRKASTNCYIKMINNTTY